MSSAGIGTMNWTVSWTFSKEYSLTCCAGPSWINGDDNFRYAMDSNNKTQEFAFHGYWDLPFGKGQKFANSHSGIWRDLAVRKRPTEVDAQLGIVVALGAEAGVSTPLTARLVELVHEIERGARPQSLDALDALGGLTAPVPKPEAGKA